MKKKGETKGTVTDEDITGSFQTLIDDKELMFQAWDLHPDQIEIFAPDGTAIFCNQACLKFNNIPDANLIMGKYNVLNDPILNDQMGLYDLIHDAFKGKVTGGTYSPPVQDLVDRGVIDEKPFEAAILDFNFYPVFKDGKLMFVVSSCTVKNVYQGRPEVAKAKEYIDSHWQDEYNAKAVAKAANMGVTQLYKVFNEYVKMTPKDYHRKIKIEHIKEKLADKSLSIKEAFAQCGESSRSWVATVFKEITGMTPSEYRMDLQ